MQKRSYAFGMMMMVAAILSIPVAGRAQSATSAGGQPAVIEVSPGVSATASQAVASPPDPARLAAAMLAYRARASMERHKDAYEAFVSLASDWQDDYGMQIWCARTSFYYAHRRVQADDKDGCAKVARAGSKCARRAIALRPGDYDGRYWELMNWYKEGATLSLVSILKSVKPIRGWLEELIGRDPKRPEGHAFLAMAYRELPSVVSWGDDKKALEQARIAQQLAPRDPESLLELAEALRENGDKESAREFYGRVQTSDVPRDLEWETEDARAWARKQLADMD